MLTVLISVWQGFNCREEEVEDRRDGEALRNGIQSTPEDIGLARRRDIKGRRKGWAWKQVRC